MTDIVIVSSQFSNLSSGRKKSSTLLKLSIYKYLPPEDHDSRTFHLVRTTRVQLKCSYVTCTLWWVLPDTPYLFETNPNHACSPVFDLWHWIVAGLPRFPHGRPPLALTDAHRATRVELPSEPEDDSGGVRQQAHRADPCMRASLLQAGVEDDGNRPPCMLEVSADDDSACPPCVLQAGAATRRGGDDARGA
jgi:hypothetical protein